ncbi:MAG: RNA-binding protein [Huintestinicola sp.]
MIELSRLSREDKLLVSHIDDMIYRTEKSFSVGFSYFLDERESAVAEEYIRRSGTECRYMLYGGYEDAGRKILGIYSRYEDISGVDFPISTLRFTYRQADKLTHRDFLGSLMSMQIKRNLIGDIVCSEGCTYVFLSPVAARMASGSISRIGRVGVKCEECSGSEVKRTDSFTEISGTVASLRLDCILGAALHLSREKTASLIRGGCVTVNHFPTENVSAQLSDGDVFSVRGHGRFIFAGSGSTTSKGRIHVTIKKYI